MWNESDVTHFLSLQDILSDNVCDYFYGQGEGRDGHLAPELHNTICLSHGLCIQDVEQTCDPIHVMQHTVHAQVWDACAD